MYIIKSNFYAKNTGENVALVDLNFIEKPQNFTDDL